MTTAYRKKLIEVALPLEAINRESAREKSIRHGHPSTLHLWWARRPLAAARAVLFAQLVDDPSAWPERFPSEESQAQERMRLFRIIEEMVPWEASSDEEIISRARKEIAQNWARSHPSQTANRVLAADATTSEICSYLATELPAVHDPFAGGGTIPLEAQRLGLRAIASDLNPVAVIINKALIEIPPRFANCPPVNSKSRAGGTSSRKKQSAQTDIRATKSPWKGSQGLAEDVRHYSRWMHDEAKRRIGHLYPAAEVTASMASDRADLKPLVGEKLRVIAWIWARTIECPNPTCRAHAPLVRSFTLSTKAGRRTCIKLDIDRTTSPPRVRSRVVVADAKEPEPTITRTGARCVACESPIPLEHIRAAGRSGQLGDQLLALVSEAARRRVYLEPTTAHELTALSANAPADLLRTSLPSQALGFRVQAYGLTTHRDLFTRRQLILLSTFADLVEEARQFVRADISQLEPIRQNQLSGYEDAIATYLGLSVSRMANYSSCLCFWSSHAKDELVKQVFSRNALVMAPDYAETNPFADSSGGWIGVVEYVAKAIPSIPEAVPGVVEQRSATQKVPARNLVVSCDPPYYDNIGYADLSDFFYVWLRLALRQAHSDLTAGMLTPKNDELVSEPGRFDSKELAQEHFEIGLSEAFAGIHDQVGDECPTTIYYAFKQAESEEAQSDGRTLVASSGWEKMLSALCSRDFMVVGTWPARTELSGGLRELRRNALASSIVLACRKRPATASSTTRPELRRTLATEIPAALRTLQHGNIAPVDVAQASIGPGMAIFSRYAKVLEADGSQMTVRSALQLINEVLDEHLTEQEGELDADSRFAVTWYENRAFDAGPYGEAETLAKARAVAVEGIAEAGILKSGGGRVRLLTRGELPDDWDPTRDSRLTTWEATQHLIKRLEEQGEVAASQLLAKLGSLAGAARDLAYRLYSTCERKGWAEEARAYNGLVVAWPDLERLAAQSSETASTVTQQRLL